MAGIKNAFTPANTTIISPILKMKSWDKVTYQDQLDRRSWTGIQIQIFLVPEPVLLM